MKKVLVTGVTGQDGSYMVDFLLENTEHEVFGMVRRSAKPDYSNLRNALNNPRFKLVTGDLSDSHSIESVTREVMPDYFINFAAQSFVGSSWQLPEQTFDIIALGTLRCLEAIRKVNPNCRFYSAGSSEEMGDVLYSPQNLKHPIRPRSPYAAAKAAARHVTKVYRESYNLYAIHSILYNHESERRGEEFVTRKITKGIARIAKSIKNNQSFEPILLGNIDSKRDWSHAKDFIKGIWMMLNQEIYNKEVKLSLEWYRGNSTYHPKTQCGTVDKVDIYSKTETEFLSKNIEEYILSSGETHTVREFIEKAFNIAGISGSWIGEGEGERFITLQHGLPIRGPVDLIRINKEFYRPNEVSLLLGDSTPARTELGWKPEISFDKLVELMVKCDLNDNS